MNMSRVRDLLLQLAEETAAVRAHVEAFGVIIPYRDAHLTRDRMRLIGFEAETLQDLREIALEMVAEEDAVVAEVAQQAAE